MSFFPSVAFLTDSAGFGEWVVLFIVILVVVGPKRLPEVARKLGRTMEMLRRAADEFKTQLMTMDQEPPPSHSTTTDADGVPHASDETTDGTSQAADASPAETYPDEAVYPGNEEQAAGTAGAGLPEEPSHAEKPPPSGGESLS